MSFFAPSTDCFLRFLLNYQIHHRTVLDDKIILMILKLFLCCALFHLHFIFGVNCFEMANA